MAEPRDPLILPAPPPEDAVETVDDLRYYLKRLPPRAALLAAVENRLVGLLAPPGAAVVSHLWSDSEAAGGFYGYDSDTLVVLARGPYFEQDLSTLTRYTLEHYALSLASAEYVIDNWFPFIAPAAYEQYAGAADDGYHLAHALTGHYVLTPWERYLAPHDARLRPHYTTPIVPEGIFYFIIARRQPPPVTPELPPMALREAVAIWDDYQATLPPPHANGYAARALRRRGTISAPEPGEAAPPPGRALSPTLLRGVLIAVIMLGAFMAQSALRAAPTAPGGALPWLLAVAGGMVGMRLLVDREQAGAGDRSERRAAPARRRWLVPVALALAWLAGSASAQPLIALPLWLQAVILAVYGLAPVGVPAEAAAPTEAAAAAEAAQRRERALVIGLTLLALAIRVALLTTHPFVFSGTEASLNLDAWAVATGGLRNPFSTGWLTNPTLPAFVQALPLLLFGRTILAARILAALVGAATVPVIYWVGKRLWSTRVGLVAAIMLAGSHVHVHYSRLGMTNIWDPLLALLAVGGAAVAWHSRDRRHWLVAGLGLGLGAYVFTSAHLLPLIVAALALVAALVDGAALRAQWRHIAAAALVALVVALPQLRYYNANRPIFMERADALGIVQNGWLAQETARSGRTTAAVLGDQFWQAALAFNATVDRDTTYNPRIPLLQRVAGLFFLIGVGMALFHLGQVRYSALLVWLLTTVIFGGMLLVEPPHSRRLLIAVPAALLLAARAVVWLAEKAARFDAATWGDRPTPRPLLLTLLGVALLLAGLDVGFYFGPYRAAPTVGDRNTEIATALAGYLNQIDPDSHVFFHGPPTMYGSFTTIPFLAPGFEPGRNLVDVFDPAEAVVDSAETVVHIFLPERSGEVELIRARHPGGATATVNGVYAAPLFTTYEYAP